MDNFTGSTDLESGILINKNLSTLNDAWVTEANAPEVLPFKTEIVESLKTELIFQQVSSFHFSYML